MFHVSCLQGLLVLDFSQFLAGPAAAMRLADLGARVIKIERPQGGDICRQLYITNLGVEGESTLFHSINRNKEGFAADLKNPADLAQVRQLIERADVLIENFRPGVMAKLGLDYESVQKINPCLVYGTVTGYGTEGPWKSMPGRHAAPHHALPHPHRRPHSEISAGSPGYRTTHEGDPSEHRTSNIER